MDGIINLDKPAGLRSVEVLKKVREILQVSKPGYTGTLDPQVTGVLPILLGKAVKLSEILSKSDKTYVGTMHLHKDVSKAQIEKAFKQFTGKIKQIPPKLSAVKRVEREREIYALKLKSLSNKNAEFEVRCQHGLYVRKLIHDLGEKLGIGAHMTKLRRIQSGPFNIKDSVKLEEISPSKILPVEAGVANLPKIWVDDGAKLALKQGSPVYIPGISKLTPIEKDNVVAILDSKDKLAGLGIAEMNSKEIDSKKTGLAVKTDLVLI